MDFYSVETATPKKKHGIIIETSTEARQAEPRPTILAACLAAFCLYEALLLRSRQRVHGP
jgi:hypothetical protein